MVSTNYYVIPGGARKENVSLALSRLVKFYHTFCTASYYDNCDLEISQLYITCTKHSIYTILKFSFNKTEWLIDQSISSCQCVIYLNSFCTCYIPPSLPFFSGTSLQINSSVAMFDSFTITSFYFKPHVVSYYIQGFNGCILTSLDFNT